VKVNVENYGSNEEMLAKLQAGGSKYDLIQPSDYVIEEMIRDGRLEELDLAAIPNASIRSSRSCRTTRRGSTRWRGWPARSASW
jgi:spermidine/putrescine-binding protein